MESKQVWQWERTHGRSRVVCWGSGQTFLSTPILRFVLKQYTISKSKNIALCFERVEGVKAFEYANQLFQNTFNGHSALPFIHTLSITSLHTGLLELTQTYILSAPVTLTSCQLSVTMYMTKHYAGLTYAGQSLMLNKFLKIFL